MKPSPHHLADHPAWQQAWRLRCCPPDHLLRKPPDNHLHDHLELCPWCRQAMEFPLFPVPEPAWPGSPEMPPVVGQLYTLQQKLAGWGPKSRYYNPPIVLILDCPDKRSVLVCQTYGDPELAGPDDVVLGADFSGFAQPWNCYTLLQTDLEIHLGDVDPQVVAMVRKRAEQDLFSPQPGSLLWFFRQMEVETGYFFSSMAVAQLLGGYESESILSLAGTDSAKILQDLRRLPLEFADTPLTTATPLDLLFWAEPDPQRLPLAAADSETTMALVFTLAGESVATAATLPFSITFCEYVDGLLTVTGSIPGAPPGDSTWLLRWKTADRLIDPVPEHSGHDDTFFWATFSLSPDQAMPPNRLVVRLLRKDQG
jgi:hypothetical protein